MPMYIYIVYIYTKMSINNSFKKTFFKKSVIFRFVKKPS